tara:strand:+ start:156 stop:995 length:840 start_codon:yes stop_codon:yes gene_type:complete
MTTASVWVSRNNRKTLDVSEYIDNSPWSGDYAVFNMMIYGEPGEGKTPLLGTVVDVPDMLPALLIDCDSGTLSVRDREGLNTLHLPKMAAQLTLQEKRDISPWKALEEAYRWLAQDEHNYKTIMLDGGTEIQRYCELECIAYGIEKKNSGDHDPELAELADYRRIHERMKRMYMRFRDLQTQDGRRINFLATAHEGKAKDDLSGKMFIQPLFIGKATVLISSVFDIIGRLTTADIGSKKDVKVLVPAINGTARGRDRSGNLGGFIEDPTMLKIAEKIKG